MSLRRKSAHFRGQDPDVGGAAVKARKAGFSTMALQPKMWLPAGSRRTCVAAQTPPETEGSGLVSAPPGKSSRC